MESLNWSTRNPVAMVVLVVFVALVGGLSLGRLPLQLFPDIDRPMITVNTRWATASPEEVESEILEPLERVLQGIPGVEELEGNANPSEAQITLRFSIGTDMRNAMIEVLGRLNRLQPLPRDADRPVVTLGGEGTSNDTLSWFFVQLLPGATGPIGTHRRFIEDTIRPRLESIPG